MRQLMERVVEKLLHMLDAASAWGNIDGSFIVLGIIGRRGASQSTRANRRKDVLMSMEYTIVARSRYLCNDSRTNDRMASSLCVDCPRV